MKAMVWPQRRVVNLENCSQSASGRKMAIPEEDIN